MFAAALYLCRKANNTDRDLDPQLQVELFQEAASSATGCRSVDRYGIVPGFVYSTQNSHAFNEHNMRCAVALLLQDSGVFACSSTDKQLLQLHVHIRQLCAE
jgi:hypothetical protein